MFLALSACAGGQSFNVERPPLPTQAEVIEYITSHWSEWEPRFARFASRQGEAAALGVIKNVSCDYLYSTPECWAEVTARFGDGSEQTQKMFSQFERDEAGKLKEVIVMYHVRRR